MNLPITSSNINWVPGLTLDEVEKYCILQAFRFYRGNKSQTAKSLNISVRTLENKLEKYESEQKNGEALREADKIRRDEILARQRGLPQQPIHNPPRPTIDVSHVYRTSAGVDMEPASNVPSKQSVPVSKREEIQTVLPRQASAHGSNRRR